MSSKKHLFEGVRNILRHSKYPKRGKLREVIHHSSVFFFFHLGYLLILSLKLGIENSDEGLWQRTTAKMCRNEQHIWQFSGAGDAEVRDLRGICQKGRLKD